MDNENVAKLESNIEGLLASLELEDDNICRENVLKEIHQKQERLLEVYNDHGYSNPSFMCKESRSRKPTPKMADYMELERERRSKGLIRKFSLNYDKWKQAIKLGRTQLRSQVTDEFDSVLAAIKNAQRELLVTYDELREISPPEQEMRRRMDTCSAVTDEMIRILESKTLCNSTTDGQYRPNLNSLLSRDENNSIFSTVTPRESSHDLNLLKRGEDKSSSSIAGSCVSSHNSRTSSQKRADAAAELAALEAEERVRKEQESKQAEIDDLHHKVLLKQRELEGISKQRELEKARARFKVYDSECNSVLNRNLLLDNDSVAFPTHGKHGNIATVQDANILAQTIQNSITLGRLPAPEPSVFTGDPLRYVEWKTSFMALIGTKNLPVAEKMYYLKRYLGGSALKSVEGYSYNNNEQSYKGAWDLLEERFGHKFKIQEAFRERLNNWVKIDSKDSAGLQAFADFLRACQDAMPHVFGLGVLNDSKENQRLAAKLPDWVAARWNRDVTLKLDECGDYPTFAEFVKFVTKEAKIACNPVTSFSALKTLDTPNTPKGKEIRSTPLKGGPHKVKENRDVIRNKGTAFATTSQENGKSDANESMIKPKFCVFCKVSDHQISTCSKFEKIPLNERKQYVVTNKLCFSCLKKGHNSSYCHRKLQCAKCKRRHPTVLHVDRDVNATQIQGVNPIAQIQENSPVAKTEVSETGKDSESASALSCSIGHGETNSTSMIVPVWVSSIDSPDKEVLTYALLGTQRDSTFVLEDTAKAVTRHCQPIHLKLSTMTSSSTIESHAVLRLISARNDVRDPHKNPSFIH